jgi:CRP-like cAMP-binding protein
MHPNAQELAGVPLFEGLSTTELDQLARHFDVEEYPQGRMPAREGAHGYAFFVLSEGSAHAELDGTVLEQLGPGSVFGEMAFFAPDSRRSASVVAETPIRVLAMFGTEFRQMQQGLPQVAERLQKLVDERSARVQGTGDQPA